jgi:hypothetical protein
MRAFLTSLLLAAVATTPPFAQVCAGRGVASPSGEPLFMRLAGLPLPGWLAAVDRPALANAYGGYRQREPLPNGATLLILREQGLAAAYVVQANRCTGDLVAEPLELPSANDAKYTLTRSGFKATKRFVATRTGDYALDAEAYERTANGYVERYVFAERYLAVAAYFPAALRHQLDALEPEFEAGVAGYLKDHP